MKRIFYLAIFCATICVNSSSACDGLSAVVGSNVYIGNGEYLLTIEVCESVSNSDGINSANIYGIIVTVNGANVIGINTPSITGITSGLTVNANQVAPNQVEYGDWGNGAAPILLAYGDPLECWTIELIVDGPAVTIDVLSSSFDGALQPGAGMSLYNGIWGCGNGLAVPPVVCNSDWIPPVLCEGSTSLVDLNLTTVNTGVFSGVGVDTLTNSFDPTGLSGAISVTFTVGDALFNCSTTLDIIINPILIETINTTICENGSYTYPDGTTSVNIVVNETNVSTLVSAVTGCDSIITTNITVQTIAPVQQDVSICLGEDYTYPDGSVSSNITTPESQTSTLQSIITGCDSTIVTNISLIAIPTVQIDEVVCSGDSFTFPDGSISSNIIISESQTSTIQSVISGCDSIVVTNISVAAPIMANISIDMPTGCVPQEVVVSNMSSGGPFNNCFWDFGDGTTSNDCGPQTITYSFDGTYTISLIVENGCYIDTSEVTFVGTQCSIYIPNIISLSSNSGNNTWFVSSEGIESFNCVIINRWGNLVKTLTSVNDYWDGTTESGNPMNEGTYYYLIDVVYNNGLEEQKHGFIQLVD